MWPFNKKRDVIDLTQFKSKTKIGEDVKDFTQEQQEVSDPLGFLGTMAVSAEKKDDVNERHLKVKIEDFEYKLDNLSRKLNAMIDRVDLVEKKVDRDTRRGV